MTGFSPMAASCAGRLGVLAGQQAAGQAEADEFAQLPRRALGQGVGKQLDGRVNVHRAVVPLGVHLRQFHAGLNGHGGIRRHGDDAFVHRLGEHFGRLDGHLGNRHVAGAGSGTGWPAGVDLARAERAMRRASACLAWRAFSISASPRLGYPQAASYSSLRCTTEPGVGSPDVLGHGVDGPDGLAEAHQDTPAPSGLRR